MDVYGGNGTSRAVVVGGGIGGLTAALALVRRGWRVTVLERAAELKPVGAGIGLAPNAQRALDVVGLGDAVRALAAWQGRAACAHRAAAGSPVPIRRPRPRPSAARWSCCTGRS